MSPESKKRLKRKNIDTLNPEVIAGVRAQFERATFALTNIGDEIRVNNLCEVLQNITNRRRSVSNIVYSLMDNGFINYTKKPRGIVDYSRFVSKDTACAIAVAILANLKYREERGFPIPHNEHFYSGVKKILETIDPNVAEAIKIGEERKNRSKKQPKAPVYVAEIIEGLNKSIIDNSKKRRIEEPTKEIKPSDEDAPQPQIYTAETITEVIKAIKDFRFSGLETFEGVRSKLSSVGVTDDLIKQAIEPDNPKARWRLIMGQNMSVREFNSYLEKLRDNLK